MNAVATRREATPAASRLMATPHGSEHDQSDLSAAGVPRFLQPKCAACGAPQTQGAQAQSAGAAAVGIRIGAANDAFEREADAVAAQVLRAAGPSPVIGAAPVAAQRQCASCEAKDEERVLRPRRDSGGGGFEHRAAPSSVEGALRGGSHGLDAATRSFFEPRFGRDFGSVRVHSDSAAQASARDVNALAYTVGQDIVFGAGQYSPGTASGRALLAHELTHVVQQRGPLLSRATAPTQSASGGGEASAEDTGDACSTGRCEDCAGGQRDLWITVFFRRRATRRTMDILNAERSQAKDILKNCCITLKMDFDWRLLRGPSVMPSGSARPAGDADGAWDYTDDSEQLGEGTTFDGARGIPMVVADEVPGTGGGVTISNDFDRQYTGRTYMIWGRTGSNTSSNTIAHELWHVGGGLNHDPAAGSIVEGTGHDVSPEFCRRVRSLV